LLYVGAAIDPVRRLKQHHGRSRWYPHIARIDVEWHSNKKDAKAAEQAAILAENPEFNITGRQLA
jgi:hypothetical protein